MFNIQFRDFIEGRITISQWFHDNLDIKEQRILFLLERVSRFESLEWRTGGLDFRLRVTLTRR